MAEFSKINGQNERFHLCFYVSSVFFRLLVHSATVGHMVTSSGGLGNSMETVIISNGALKTAEDLLHIKSFTRCS